MARARASREVVLVLTSVHPPDDPRVRHRTVDVLASAMPVRFATRHPGPIDGSGFETTLLRGPRVARAVRGLREALRADVAVVSVHDPELIPIALIARLTGRRAVIDVHEDVPAQILHKDWLPAPLRPPMAVLASLLLRAAEQFCVITLAEPNYADLFRRAHPVFANYPIADSLPASRLQSDGSVVYVGDVTTARGAEIAVQAVARLRRPAMLTLIGRCREPLRSELAALASRLHVPLRIRGFLPHEEAMRHVAQAAVGISPLLGAPNHRESLPSKVIEYLAVGIPVVASDLPGTRRIVAGLPGVTLVPAGDVDAWSTALDETLGNPGIRAAARASSASVRSKHTWASDALRDLYRAQLQASSR